MFVRVYVILLVDFILWACVCVGVSYSCVCVCSCKFSLADFILWSSGCVCLCGLFRCMCVYSCALCVHMYVRKSCVLRLLLKARSRSPRFFNQCVFVFLSLCVGVYVYTYESVCISKGLCLCMEAHLWVILCLVVYIGNS